MRYAKQYFQNHKNVEVLYFTSDRLAFFDEQNAELHAAHLDDPAILPITRKEALAAMHDLGNDWEEEGEYDPLDELDAE